MADWALSTNLFTFAQVSLGFFGWPASAPEGEVIRQMAVGDVIVPKYSQTPAYGADEEGETEQRAYFEIIGADYDQVLASYQSTVQSGAAAVPHVLRVSGLLEDDPRPPGGAWAQISVSAKTLDHPLSTKEFQRLRVVPPEVAAQFKAAVSRGRHLQQLPKGAANTILDVGSSPDRGDRLRQYSLVRAATGEEALGYLNAAGRSPQPGDRAFLATSGGLMGVFNATPEGGLRSVSVGIPRTPLELRDLFEEATRKAKASDYFTPQNAVRACDELQALLEGQPDLLPVDDFARWHDRYELLAQKVTLADELARRPEPAIPPEPAPVTETDEPEKPSIDEAAALAGLTIEAVRAELPDYMAIPDEVLAEAVTALRSGKHLMLGGPPGTGKSTVAEAIARAVMGTSYDVSTATADWTTFDTIGGYLPDTEHGIRFVPGVVLRALRSGSWLVIDEINRADIDKAFGPLFTLLAGGESTATRSVTLPYQDTTGKGIAIEWTDQPDETDDFTITPHWRLIGTLNVADKASLFQMSFAFLRRFAVVDVPLPPPEMYAAFISGRFTDVPDDVRPNIEKAAAQVAYGPRLIGPAIMADIGRFVTKAIAPIAGGPPTYSDPVTAFVTALKLFVVPQYDGSEPSEGGKLVSTVRSVWPDRDDDFWSPLRDAFTSVALK
jgi:MoxR-like ATPase